MVIFWYAMFGVLLAGYLALAGYDYGVGLALPTVGGDEPGRRRALNAVGPFFLGNEVWIVAAAGVLLAAFPRLEGDLFGSAYPLVAAIVAGLVAVSGGVQLRSRLTSGRRAMDGVIVLASAVLALGWGMLLGNLLVGLPPGDLHPTRLFGWYPWLCGLALLGIVALHGSAYLAWRGGGAGGRPTVAAGDTVAARDTASRAGAAGHGAAAGHGGTAGHGGPAGADELGQRAGRQARRLFPVTAVLVLLAVGGGLATGRVRAGIHQPVPAVLLTVALLGALAGAGLALRRGRWGWAFAGTTLAAALPVFLVGAARYPEVLPGLTVAQSAAGGDSLRFLATVGAPLIPVLFAVQALSWWAFRDRAGLPRPSYW